MTHKFLFATATLIGSAFVGAASAQSGDVALSYSHIEADALGASADADAVTLSGSANFQIRGRFGVQIDQAITHVDDDGDDATMLAGALHVHLRDDGWAGGVFLGADGGDLSVTTLTGGYEHYIYFNRSTLVGAVGYLDADKADTNGVFGLIEGRFFLQDNFRLSATGTLASIDAGGGDAEFYTIGVGGEYKLASAPVSFFGAYSHGELDEVDLSTDTVKIGVRLTSDATLLDRDRRGAGLIDVPSFADLY